MGLDFSMALQSKDNKMQDAYQQAGVDIDKGNTLVEFIKPLAHKTNHRAPYLLGGIGGFAALVDMQKLGFSDPLLVLSCDGIGTKLELALEYQYYDGLGFDLVAMAVNDVLVLAAKPVAFLDYYACGKLDLAVAKSIITSIAKACEVAGCALAGGETAEMPGFYEGGKVDLAGFALGVIERQAVVTKSKVIAGDYLVGIASSGFHSNGFSLVRYLLKQHKVNADLPPPYVSSAKKLYQDLLTPTRIYSQLFEHIAPLIKSAAHITGGGLIENLPRVFDKNLYAKIDKTAWAIPENFLWLQDLGGLSDNDMYRSFNCGIGIVLIVAKQELIKLESALKALSENYVILGQMVEKSSANDASVVIA